MSSKCWPFSSAVIPTFFSLYSYVAPFRSLTFLTALICTLFIHSMSLIIQGDLAEATNSRCSLTYCMYRLTNTWRSLKWNVWPICANIVVAVFSCIFGALGCGFQGARDHHPKCPSPLALVRLVAASSWYTCGRGFYVLCAWILNLTHLKKCLISLPIL